MSEFTAHILVVGITAIGCVLLIVEISPQILKSRLDIILMPTDKDRREGWTDARSAVGFCLGSGLFGSYNSD